MAKALSKRALGGGKENPVGQFVDGVSRLKNILGGVAGSVRKASNPRRR